MTKDEIEHMRKWLRGITDPDDWVDALCDQALRAEAAPIEMNYVSLPPHLREKFDALVRDEVRRLSHMNLGEGKK